MTRDRFTHVSAGATLALLLVGTVQGQATPPAEEDAGVPYLVPPSVVQMNERQRERIVTLRRELHDRQCTLSGELLQAQEELRAQMAREPRSAESIAEASRRVSEIRERIVAARQEAEEQAADLLDSEQRAVLAKWREGRRRAGGEVGGVPYTVLPGIKSDEPDIENPEDPERKPQY